jgi:hypothetical protein
MKMNVLHAHNRATVHTVVDPAEDGDGAAHHEFIDSALHVVLLLNEYFVLFTD